MKKKLRTKKTGREHGGSTLEILIAFAVLILSITAVLLVGFGNQSVSVDAETNSEALSLAQEVLENARAQSRDNFFSVLSSSDNETLGPLSYTKRLDITDIAPCKKEAKANVSWTNDPSRNQFVELTSAFTSTAVALALGLDCDTDTPSDWDNPTTYGSVDLSPSGNQGTGIDVSSRNGILHVFLTSYTGADTKSDFWIINAVDPQNPVIRSQLNVGKPLNKVDISGDYAFTVGQDPTAQLQIIGISDLDNPTLIATSSFPGVDPAGSFPEGVSVYFYGDKLYVGTKRTAGPELHVFDVSNPSNPASLGSLELNHNVNDILIQGNLAYIASSADFCELIVVDISNPASMTNPCPAPPIPAGATVFDANGDQDGMSIYVLGNKAYLGRKRGSGDPSSLPDFHILDISAPSSVSELGLKDLDLNSNTAVVGVVVRGPLAFLATDHSTAGFQVWNISDPTNIFAPSSCNIYNYSEKATDIDFENNMGFLSNESNNAMRIIYDQASACPIP